MNYGTSKLALGTVQFGLDYGINNTSGIVSYKEMSNILTIASENQINVIDTAHCYGSSESKLGNYLRDNVNSFKIVSKLSQCKSDEVHKIFNESLRRLNISSIYGYLIHSFQNYIEECRILNHLLSLKEEGIIEKIGFSLYYPSELEYLLNTNVRFDILQIPYNLFDRRFEPYFQQLSSMGVDIHVRSVFLQGLLLKDHIILNKRFSKIKEKLILLKDISINSCIPLVDICLNFALLNDYLSNIIVGIDNSIQLQQIIASNSTMKRTEQLKEILETLKEDDEDILIPSRWNK